jgi:hypothetical protein
MLSRCSFLNFDVMNADARFFPGVKTLKCIMILAAGPCTA